MNRFQDWLEQAERDRDKARLDFSHEYYEWCCFTAQQAAEKAVKAMGMKLGFDVWGHAVSSILTLLKSEMPIPDEILEEAQLLDTFYIPTRYPNGFNIGKPADYYNRRMGGAALDACDKIIAFCKDIISRSQ